MWFEGIEKKLEIILKAPNEGVKQDKECWQQMVKACGAEIISHTSTPKMDAYLLSESSLFVWNDRLLMITCGKTRLIDSVFELLKYVAQKEVAQVFYERKNLMFPTEQCSDFEADVEKLESVFPGKSFRFGAANAEHVHMFIHGELMEISEPDSTLQVLMNDIGERATTAFSEETKETEDATALRRSLFAPFKPMKKDDFYFSPQGYSCNLVEEDRYMTIHVSPQAESSYTSFEMNALHETKEDVLDAVVRTFEPKNAFVAVTTSLDAVSMTAHQKNYVPKRYKIAGKGTYESENGYLLTYMNLLSV